MFHSILQAFRTDEKKHSRILLPDAEINLPCCGDGDKTATPATDFSPSSLTFGGVLGGGKNEKINAHELSRRRSNLIHNVCAATLYNSIEIYRCPPLPLCFHDYKRSYVQQLGHSERVSAPDSVEAGHRFRG